MKPALHCFVRARGRQPRGQECSTQQELHALLLFYSTLPMSVSKMHPRVLYTQHPQGTGLLIFTGQASSPAAPCLLYIHGGCNSTEPSLAPAAPLPCSAVLALPSVKGGPAEERGQSLCCQPWEAPVCIPPTPTHPLCSHTSAE